MHGVYETMPGFLSCQQIQCHKAAWKAEKQEIGVCGRLTQQEPMGFPGVHGGGFYTWQQAQDACFQWLTHLLQGICMFFPFINLQIQWFPSANLRNHYSFIILGIQCDNRLLLVAVAGGVQQRWPHCAPGGVPDHTDRQNREACQCLEGCWYHYLQFLHMVEEP